MSKISLRDMMAMKEREMAVERARYEYDLMLQTAMQQQSMVHYPVGCSPVGCSVSTSPTVLVSGGGGAAALTQAPSYTRVPINPRREDKTYDLEKLPDPVFSASAEIKDGKGSMVFVTVREPNGYVKMDFVNRDGGLVFLVTPEEMRDMVDMLIAAMYAASDKDLTE